MNKKQEELLKAAANNIIEAVGEDSNREGLKDTPNRFARFINEFFIESMDFKFTTFSSEGNKDMVLVKDIQFYSFCEHHILPIIGVAHVAYIPNKKIVGLSKIPRTVEKFSHRLQNQERLTANIHDYLMERLDASGIAVSLTARHMCMELRGVKSCKSQTTTTKVSGVFAMNPSLKDEFLQSIK